jgi:WD repeat-containing protein 48
LPVNLGRWILRYLFANLIDEEIKRDEAYRQKLNEGVEMRQAASMATPPVSIPIPPIPGLDEDGSAVTTPRAKGPHPLMTPGLAIGVATPGSNLRDGNATPGSPLDRRSSGIGRPSEDYFSSAISSVDPPQKPAVTPAAEKEPAKDETPKSPLEGKEKDNGKSPTAFGKKFRMGMSFGTKKLGRSSSTAQVEKPVVVEEKKDEENKSESSSNHEKEVDDSFLGVIQKIHNEYEKQLQENPLKLVETKITPSLPIDTPVLKLPPGTPVIIQEETSGGSSNLYRGTIESVGVDADIIEQKGPMWLGDVLLTVRSLEFVNSG